MVMSLQVAISVLRRYLCASFSSLVFVFWVFTSSGERAATFCRFVPGGWAGRSWDYDKQCSKALLVAYWKGIQACFLNIVTSCGYRSHWQRTLRMAGWCWPGGWHHQYWGWHHNPLWDITSNKYGMVPVVPVVPESPWAVPHAQATIFFLSGLSPAPTKSSSLCREFLIAVPTWTVGD